MWWNTELKKRRQEVEAIRATMRSKAEASAENARESITHNLPIKEIAALGFAAVSMIGPIRAVRLALLAASAYKAVSALKGGKTGSANHPRRSTNGVTSHR